MSLSRWWLFSSGKICFAPFGNYASRRRIFTTRFAKGHEGIAFYIALFLGVGCASIAEQKGRVRPKKTARGKEEGNHAPKNGSPTTEPILKI